MSVRKNRPVLYEVVRRNPGAREAPWPRRDTSLQTPPEPPASVAPPETDALTQESAEPKNGLVPVVPAAVMPATQPRTLIRTEPPPLRLLDKGVQVTLNWPAVVVTALVLLLLPILAYQVGKSVGRKAAPVNTAQNPGPTGAASNPANSTNTTQLAQHPAPSAAPGQQPDAGPEGDRSRRPEVPSLSRMGTSKVAVPKKATDAAPPESTVNEGALQPSNPDTTAKPTPPTVPPPKPQFQKGYHYVVIQHFGKSKMDEAKESLEFLSSHGVPCVIHEGADIRLIAQEAFLIEQKDAAAAQEQKKRCDELKRKIREIGQEYVRTQPNGYWFDGCAEKKF